MLASEIQPGMVFYTAALRGMTFVVMKLQTKGKEKWAQGRLFGSSSSMFAELPISDLQNNKDWTIHPQASAYLVTLQRHFDGKDFTSGEVDVACEIVECVIRNLADINRMHTELAGRAGVPS
jgi:hypothetical protein